MALTEQDVQDYIRRKLGGGVICVELTPDQLQDAIDRAKLWMQQWVGHQKTALLTMTGATEYAIPTAWGCETVVDVVFQLNTDSLTDIWKWADVEVNVADIMAVRPNYSYVDLVQRQQYLELGRRVLSGERSWDWDRAKARLVITPPPSAGETALVYYLADTIDVAYLKRYEAAVFQDYALAQAMETLGWIRTKFSEVPTASGSTTLNGDTLLSNAQQLIDKCEEKARALAPPMPFFCA
jgi:hypothetical protein